MFYLLVNIHYSFLSWHKKLSNSLLSQMHIPYHANLMTPIHVQENPVPTVLEEQAGFSNLTI